MKTNHEPNTIPRPPVGSPASASSAPTSANADGGKPIATANGSPSPASVSASTNSASLKLSPQGPVSVKSFLALVEEGIKAWEHAGDMLVVLVSFNGMQIFQTIIRECPWMTQNLLDQFYAIGKRRLYPKVLVACRNSGVARRLSLLPYQTQKEICEKGVAVAVDIKRPGTLKRLDQVTFTEAVLVFQGSKVLTVPEQKKILERNGRTKPTSLQVFSEKASAWSSSQDIQSLGIYLVEVTPETGEAKFTKHQGQRPLVILNVPLAPKNGKLVCYVELKKMRF